MAQTGVHYLHPASASFMSKVLKLALRLMGQKRYLGKQLRDPSKIKNDPDPVNKALKKVANVKEETFENRPCWTFEPKNGQSNKVIYYIHGGGHIFNLLNIHWNFIAKIITATSATVVTPNFPLAPQDTAKDTLGYLEKHYRRFLSQYPKKEIYCMGDSAGGGLAISFAQCLNDWGLQQPKHIITVSPWLDVSLTNPGIKAIDPKDLALNVESLQEAGRMYAGAIDTKDRRVSPIYGRFDNIAPVSIFMGGEDIFAADSRTLKEQLDKEGTFLNYYEYPKMIHCWAMLPILKEAKVAFPQMMDLLK